MKTATDFTDEVQAGLSQEERIARRWAEHHPNARGFLKGGEFDDFDFVVFRKDGVVLCYLEVKFRRIPFATYGDAMFPARKHDFAKRSIHDRLTPVFAVTEYACGTLVEVELWRTPDARREVSRRDRPGMKPVPHVFYEKDSMRVLDD